MSPRMRLGQRKEMSSPPRCSPARDTGQTGRSDTAPHHPVRATRSAAPQSSRQPLWAAFGSAIPVRKQGDCLLCAGFFSGFTQDYSSFSRHKNLYWPPPRSGAAGFCETPRNPPERVATPGREVGWVSLPVSPLPRRPAPPPWGCSEKQPPAGGPQAASVIFLSVSAQRRGSDRPRADQARCF